MIIIFRYNDIEMRVINVFLTDAEEINVEELTNNIIITTVVILVIIMVFAISFWALRKVKS